MADFTTVMAEGGDPRQIVERLRNVELPEGAAEIIAEGEPRHIVEKLTLLLGPDSAPNPSPPPEAPNPAPAPPATPAVEGGEATLL